MVPVRFTALGAALVLACVAMPAHANDVLVTVSGGKMTVKGDADPNVVHLASSERPDRVR